jgi:hypothetical protein
MIAEIEKIGEKEIGEKEVFEHSRVEMIGTVLLSGANGLRVFQNSSKFTFPSF